ncbi:MAG TPA: CPBP family intramembrane glutamic endopeptidase [Bacteroidales bacterium]|nr:CPBP family intramembrane glutamic endopeptidase [Bacteroidales bacterium]
MRRPVLQDLSPFARIVFVVVLVIASFLAVFLPGILLVKPLFHVDLLSDFNILDNLGDPVTVMLLKYLQVLQDLALFLIPPLLASFLFSPEPARFLGLKQKSGVRIYLLVLLIMFACLPFLNWTVTVNEAMKLPGFLKGVEQWMMDAEDQAARLTDVFLKSETFGGFAFSLLMIAILPAIGEELFFRGLLQRLFRDWLKNPHVAIVLVAVIFGIFHLQFYGILPRILLGLLLGYLYYWSGSLWVPVFAHFLNNGSAVVISFLADRGLISVTYEKFGATDNAFLIAGSAVLTGLLIWGVLKSSRSFPPGNGPFPHPE